MAQQSTSQQISQNNLSPAELSYLFDSLSLPTAEGGPIRPDGRSPVQFRPLTAETGILPGTNGSARVGFADGTEAIVGVKAEVETTENLELSFAQQVQPDQDGDEDGTGEENSGLPVTGRSSWVQMAIEIPGFRDDDALPVFLAEMMRESLVGTSDTVRGDEKGMIGGLKGRLVINRRWHWRLYIDVHCPFRSLDSIFHQFSALPNGSAAILC
jgi:exosome complex component RRP42